MTDMTYTLTIDQLTTMVQQANSLGQEYVLQAVLDAGYSEGKQTNVQEHIDHSGAALNDILEQTLLQTPEIRQELAKLRPVSQ
jgi:hypothetical protein